MKIILSLIIVVIVAFVGWEVYRSLHWDKTFAKSDKVNVKKVKFHNRYGITLVGDLYMPIKLEDK